MTSDTAFFIQELTQVAVSDILLLTLVTIFFLSGLFYKVKVTKDVWNTRVSLKKMKADVQRNAEQEKSIKTELQELMHAQNENMAKINTMKRKKADMSHYPEKLQKELDELTAWCSEKNIAVNIERGMASRRLTQKKNKSF